MAKRRKRGDGSLHLRKDGRWEGRYVVGRDEKGFPITMTEEAAAHTYVAGAKEEDGRLVTSGGRVLGVTAVAEDLPKAIEEAYRLAQGVTFENAYCRRDIGQRALAALEG